MGQLGPPWVTLYGHISCEICGSLLHDHELHARWHEEDRSATGDRWDRGRDDRFQEEGYTDAPDDKENDSGARRS